MITQGAAVSRLAETGHVEAAYSNVRSMFELYTDLRYLALGERPDRLGKAYQAILYGMHERLRFHGDTAEAAGLPERIAAVEKEFEKANPKMYADARKVFGRPELPNHWSFMGRRALCKKIDEGGYERLNDEYKVLSWKAHGLMSAHEHVHDIPGGTLFIAPDSPAKSCTIVCTKAADFLDGAWDVIRDHCWEPSFFATIIPPLEKVRSKGT
jgi:hypothetical protein